LPVSLWWAFCFLLPLFSLFSLKKYRRFLSFDFYIQFDPHFFYFYLFCFWCLLKFIFLFNFVPRHFISFNFCIQFDSHLIVIIFIPLLIYLCFSIFSVNILFNLILYLILVLIIIFAIFLIIFLIYLCFSIMSLNILFDLVFVFKFDPYSFDCYLFYQFLDLFMFLNLFPLTFHLM